MAGEGRLTPEELALRVAAGLPESPIVVALSGGADSAALAWAVSAAGLPARAVSIDHGLEGSARLMDAARAIAAGLGLDHDVIPVDSRSASETDLRDARLSALEAAAGPNEIIVTGHTRDDQAETVLGNVLRGTGTAGLGGIPRHRDRWVRPLLDVDRAGIRAVASSLGLPFVDDPQNDDMTIRRNRLRSETIPALAAGFNPELRDALARLGSSAADDDTLLSGRAATVPVRRAGESVLVPAAYLQTLPMAVAARVARRALQDAGAVVSAESIGAVIAAGLGRGSTVGGAVDVSREGPWVVLEGQRAEMPGPVPLSLDASTEWADWRFDCTGHPPIGRHAASIPRREPLMVRAPRPGDRIALAGGSKSVADALSEAGVPVRRRSRWPLIESGGTIVWIAGVRAAPVGPGERVTVRAVRRRT